MSIINDAIKKARKESGLKGVGEVVNLSEISPSAPKTSEVKWIAIVVISLTIIASLFGSMFLYNHITKIDEPVTYSITERSEPIALSRKAKPSYSEFQETIELNGIVYETLDRWAIINDKIVREGDLLPNGKLILIQKDYVKIQKNNGEELVLNLR
ncbi:MAG: hypothetical protein P9L93_03360 [Candidatus Gorgyraea atricola]|nr:hypothetical protein [Candidatus Gorgyraea atricola]